jgi:probable F420-dependent oxidoreductase
VEFALTLTPYERFDGHRDLLRVVEAAAGAGFTGISFGDHVAPPASGRVPGHYYDPLVIASAITARFDVWIFFNALVVPFRHPIPLAKAIATLDVLSEGRIALGIGSGWLESEFEAMGLPFRRRGAITDECLRAMQALWTQRPASFHGDYVSFDEVVAEPKPHNGRQPRLWAASALTDRGLRRAVEFDADGVTLLSRTPDQIAGDVARLAELAAERGKSSDGMAIAYLVDQGRRVTQAHVAADDGSNVLSSDPGEASEQIDAYRRAGVTHMAVRFPAHGADEFLPQLRSFARDVIAVQPVETNNRLV